MVIQYSFLEAHIRLASLFNLHLSVQLHPLVVGRSEVPADAAESTVSGLLDRLSGFTYDSRQSGSNLASATTMKCKGNDGILGLVHY